MSDFHFFCAICGEAMSAPPRAGGGLRECPSCLRVVPIPGYPTTPGGSSGCLGLYQPEILTVVMKFLCPGCEAKMSIDVRWEGKLSECPHCHLAFHVPMLSGPKIVEPPARAALSSLSTEEIAFLSGHAALAT